MTANPNTTDGEELIQEEVQKPEAETQPAPGTEADTKNFKEPEVNPPESTQEPGSPPLSEMMNKAAENTPIILVLDEPPSTPETPTTDPGDKTIVAQEDQKGFVAGMEGLPQAPNLATPTPTPKEPEPSLTRRADGVIGKAPGQDFPEPKAPKTTTSFEPTEFTYKEDKEFCAVVDEIIPEEQELWAHPDDTNFVYAYGVPQAIVGKDLNIANTSRDVLIEWVYRNIWHVFGLNKSCQNTDAAAEIMKLALKFPQRAVAFMCQRALKACGANDLGAPGQIDVDGRWGDKTRATTYGVLCKQYDRMRMALYAEAYGQLSSWADSNPDIYGPVFQMWVMRRI